MQKRYGVYKIKTMKELLSCEGCVLGFKLNENLQIVFKSYVNNNDYLFFNAKKSILYKYKKNKISVKDLVESSDELFLGTSKINSIEGLEIHSIHKKLQDSKQDILSENLDLLKKIIKL